MNKTILFSGGGTAGHVMINMVLIPKLWKKDGELSILDLKMELKNYWLQNVKYNSIFNGKLGDIGIGRTLKILLKL